jgi:tryptophanyl-tRNA synthetase
MKPRILTGIRPTGALHIGHYFGMLEQTAQLQNEFDIFLMLADVQALTDNFHQPKKVRQGVLEVARDILNCGIDPNKTTVFIQSQIKEIAELTVFYSNLVSVARLEQNPTVKTEIAQKRDLFGEAVTYGFLGYPVSQAADITAFDAVCVPVGHDQLPMLELTRDIVRKFNRLYGENTLLEPKERLVQTSRIRGLDGGEKMGKSLGNAIFLSDSSQIVQQKIQNARTDPAKIRLHDVGHPEICTVFEYHQLFGSDTTSIESECKTGTRGCVACKNQLASRVNTMLEPMRQEYSDQHLMKILQEGTQKASQVAQNTLARVKKAMQIDYLEIA